MTRIRRFLMALAARPAKPSLDALPMQPVGAGWCQDCRVPAGVVHEPSCSKVTPEQFRAYLRGER